MCQNVVKMLRESGLEAVFVFFLFFLFFWFDGCFKAMMMLPVSGHAQSSSCCNFRFTLWVTFSAAQIQIQVEQEGSGLVYKTKTNRISFDQCQLQHFRWQNESIFSDSFCASSLTREAFSLHVRRRFQRVLDQEQFEAWIQVRSKSSLTSLYSRKKGPERFSQRRMREFDQNLEACEQNPSPEICLTTRLSCRTVHSSDMTW